MKKSSSHGMSLMAVIVAVGIAGGLAFMVSELMLNSAKVSRSSRITGSFIDLRSQFVLINKDPAFWLTKLRESSATKDIFAPCLVKTANPKYKCPPVDDKLFDLDPELKKLAGAFHPASSPLVDINGQKIAGTNKEPHYIDVETRPCESAPNQCPLQSTGFFVRESTKETDSPGTVSFVIKIERNPSYTLVSETPMKPTYISLFVGTSWMSDSTTSPVSSGQNQGACLPRGATTYIPDACCSKKAKCLNLQGTFGGGAGRVFGISPLTFVLKSNLEYLQGNDDPYRGQAEAYQNLTKIYKPDWSVLSGNEVFICVHVTQDHGDINPNNLPPACM